MKYFWVSAALWHISTSIVLSESNARHIDSDHQFLTRDTNEWEPLLQSRGKGPQKIPTQRPSEKSPNQSHSSQLDSSRGVQHGESTLKRNRSGSPPSSLGSHEQTSTNTKPGGRSSRQITPFERNPSLAHSKQLGETAAITTSYDMKQSADQTHSKHLSSTASASDSSTDLRAKEAMARMMMPPPPPRTDRHIVMGYPVDSIIGRNWEQYESSLKLPKGSGSPSKPGSPSLNRRSSISQSANRNTVVSIQPGLSKRGYSPSSLERYGFFSGKKGNPGAKDSDIPNPRNSNISRRSLLLQRRADMPGRETHPDSLNSPLRFTNHRTVPPNVFPHTRPQSLAIDPVAEEALRNAAARARPANHYPPIDYGIAAGQVMPPPPPSPRPTTTHYPVIPPITPAQIGFGPRLPNSNSPRTPNSRSPAGR